MGCPQIRNMRVNHLRVLTPRSPADRDQAFAPFRYLVRSGSALCVLDAIDQAVDEPTLPRPLTAFDDRQDRAAAPFQQPVGEAASLPRLGDGKCDGAGPGVRPSG
jgi:hypothetical protein